MDKTVASISADPDTQVRCVASYSTEGIGVSPIITSMLRLSEDYTPLGKKGKLGQVGQLGLVG
jgi:hypothetical protein